MLALTRKSDYALVALAHLAKVPDRLSSAREIADHYRISLPILMNIMKTLTRHGMVASVRGARGGYKLARPCREISLRMVVNAMEGSVRLFQCSADRNGVSGVCEQHSWCPINVPAKKLNGKFQAFLEGVTLEEMVSESPVPSPEFVSVKNSLL